MTARNSWVGLNPLSFHLSSYQLNPSCPLFVMYSAPTTRYQISQPICPLFVMYSAPTTRYQISSTHHGTVCHLQCPHHQISDQLNPSCPLFVMYSAPTTRYQISSTHHVHCLSFTVPPPPDIRSAQPIMSTVCHLQCPHHQISDQLNPSCPLFDIYKAPPPPPTTRYQISSTHHVHCLTFTKHPPPPPHTTRSAQAIMSTV